MVWSAIFMGIAMFCLAGTLQYFSQGMDSQFQINETEEYSKETQGNVFVYLL